MSAAQLVFEVARAVLNERDGMVATLKVYADESGTHDGSPVVTVGMYIGRPSSWREWTKDWNKAKKPIKVYHAVDAHNRDCEFRGWTRERRDKLVIGLLPVLARHNLLGVAVGIHMGAFRKAMDAHPELRQLFGTPYGACFQWAMQIILAKLNESRAIQRVAFIHECNDHQVEAMASFKWAQKMDSRAVSLTFASKADFVPLQAADVLAYEANHMIRDPKKEERKSWLAMDPDPKSRTITVRHYGEENMGLLVSKLTEVRQRLIASGWDGKVSRNGGTLPR